MLGADQGAGIFVEGRDEAQDAAHQVQQDGRGATGGQLAHGGQRERTASRAHQQDGTASQFSQAAQFGQMVAGVGRGEGFLGIKDDEGGIELTDGAA